MLAQASKYQTKPANIKIPKRHRGETIRTR